MFIEGDGLLLRSWGLVDVPTLVELFAETGADGGGPPDHVDQDAARALVADAARLESSGRGHALAVVDVAHGLVVGEVRAVAQAGPGDVQLTSAMGARHRRQGYTWRALRLLGAAGESHWRATGFTGVIVRVSEGQVIRLRTWRPPSEP